MQKLTEFNKEGIENYLLNLLGDDPAESRSTKYLEALNGIGIHGLRKFIISLLEDDLPTDIIKNSYFHPNKFFKLGICRLANRVKLRLHFWNKNQLEVQTPIHFHAWDFASLLVSGSYVHDLFRVQDLDEYELAQIEEYRNSNNSIGLKSIPEHYFGMYKIPKRDGALGKFKPEWVKYVQVERKSRTIEKQGSAYFLGMEFPHQITINLKEVGSMITLVLTSETDHSNLFTFQPITQTKTFDNPAPNVDKEMVRTQLKIILDEIHKVTGIIDHE